MAAERLAGILAGIERYRKEASSLERIAALLEEVKHEGTQAQYDWLLKAARIERGHAESLIARYTHESGFILESDVYAV